MFKWHVAVMNPAIGDVAKNAADRIQTDSFRQHPAEILAVFQINKNLFEETLGFFLPDIGNDPCRVDDSINGAQAVQGSLKIGSLFLSIQI